MWYRGCNTEQWANDLFEDGCLTYKGINWCFCSTPRCNMNNVTSIRGLDDCSVNNCPNSSVCFDTLYGYKCICFPWDHECQSRLTKQCSTCTNNCCSYTYCYNGGYCQYNSATASCSCVCPPGYTGASCETCDCCLSYVCQNGGTCVNNNGQCSCICPTCYSGAYCQTYSACCGVTCQNGGTLTSVAGKSNDPRLL